MFACLQDAEIALKGHFDAVLDTIGVPDTERMGISLLKRGGHYMTLQVRSHLTFITVKESFTLFSYKCQKSCRTVLRFRHVHYS